MKLTQLKIPVSFPSKASLPLCLCVALASQTALSTEAIHEVLVTSDFRQTSEMDYAKSLSLIDNQSIGERAAHHLDEILNVAPNVNFAAGASRGRFYQIRGIGERSQFKEPLDSSVGLVVDGVDFSNLGLAGALMDVRQVEILRGPQGTNFGSNAMAGMINIVSNEPTANFEAAIDGSLANYHGKSVGAVLSGPLAEGLLGRIAVRKNTSNGFIDNDFLHRDDTHNIDDEAVRAKLRWQAADHLQIDLVGSYLNIDNGYDAFSLTHDRHTRSDEPGHDRQESAALALKSVWSGSDVYTMEALATVENTNLEYGFDWDWSDWQSVGVRGFENNIRDRQATSIDLRWLSKPGYEIFAGAKWVAGLYAYDRRVDLNYSEDADYWGAWTGHLSSRFDSRRTAAYGQLDWPFGERLSLSLGGRFERFDNDYGDSFGVDGGNADNLWGGRLALEYRTSDDGLLYISLTRGYKVGGINTDALGKALVSGDAETLTAVVGRFSYDAETLVNYELGAKGYFLDETLTVNMALFYMDRRDMQAKVAVEISTGNWTEYRENIDGADNYGAELEARWQVSDQLALFASLGLLQTQLGELLILDVDTGLPVDQSGRDQAHAPSYQYNLGMTYAVLPSLSLTVQVDGKDKFYFSDSHDQQSDSYELLHATLAYERDDLSVSLWGRNLLDEEYEVRGFYFANNPNNGWLNESYTQLGEPRVFGVAATYRF